MNNLDRDSTPDPLPVWESTGWELAQEDRRWDRWEQDYDTSSGDE